MTFCDVYERSDNVKGQSISKYSLTLSYFKINTSYKILGNPLSTVQIPVKARTKESRRLLGKKRVDYYFVGSLSVSLEVLVLSYHFLGVDSDFMLFSSSLYKNVHSFATFYLCFKVKCRLRVVLSCF